MGYSLEEYKEINAKVVLEMGGPEPTPEFFKKRWQFLNSMLAKEAIYSSDHYSALYEEQAKSNLKWEYDNFNELYKIDSSTFI